METINFETWKHYYKIQMLGKINMFGYDMAIQHNYDKCFKHFEEEKKTECLIIK